VRTVIVIGVGLLVAACGDGEPGDLALVPPQKTNILGDGQRISELNDPATNPPDGTNVIITGVQVVAIDQFDETGDGSSSGNVFVQDIPLDGPTPPYGGITLFDSSFSPPTLRIGPGDVVDVKGTYDEFEGPASFPFATAAVPGDLPEIVGGQVTLRFENKQAQPVKIPLSDLATYETGRQWIGVLATIENVKCVPEQTGTCGFGSSGRFDIKLDVPGVTNTKALPTIGNDFFDLEQSGVPLAGGATYKSVTGVVQYFFNFTITPRSIEDIQL